MSWLDEVMGLSFLPDKQLDCPGSILGANACGYPAGGIDGDRKVGSITLPIFCDHARQSKFFCPIFGDGGTNQPSPVGRHKIDSFWGDFFGGHDEVAFVFAVFVIGDDDDFSCANILNHINDRVELRSGRHGS